MVTRRSRLTCSSINATRQHSRYRLGSLSFASRPTFYLPNICFLFNPGVMELLRHLDKWICIRQLNFPMRCSSIPMLNRLDRDRNQQWQPISNSFPVSAPSPSFSPLRHQNTNKRRSLFPSPLVARQAICLSCFLFLSSPSSFLVFLFFIFHRSLSQHRHHALFWNAFSSPFFGSPIFGDYR